MLLIKILNYRLCCNNMSLDLGKGKIRTFGLGNALPVGTGRM